MKESNSFALIMIVVMLFLARSRKDALKRLNHKKGKDEAKQNTKV